MSELNNVEEPETTIAVPAEPVEQQETLPAEPTYSGREMWLPLLVATLILLLDQLSKLMVIANLPIYTSWAPLPAIAGIFQFTHTTNTGVAFGLFPDGNLLFALLALIVSAAIIYYNRTLGPGNVLLRVALGLQLGGAVGNLIDRVRLGHVTDFLDFGPWPVFNVADMAVVSGVILLAWVMLREQPEEEALPPLESSSPLQQSEERSNS